MATPKASDVLGRVTLVTGPEELLNERAVTAVRDAVRGADPEAEDSETTADQLSLATLVELSAPSLFSTVRCVVVRALEDLPDEAHEGLLGYAADPVEDVALVLVHSGGNKGKRLLDRLRTLGSVSEVTSAALRGSDVPRFVAAEVRAYGGRIAEDAAALLVQSVGQDLRALAGAAHQLVSDFPGQPLTAELVKRYFGGHAEVKGFAVADASLAGKPAAALEALRWALESGTAPVLVTSAFASGLRGLARYVAAQDAGLRGQALAREVGVPSWKLDTIRRQARGWSPSGLAGAITAVAAADAEVKGAASDAPYALEKMVITVDRARARR